MFFVSCIERIHPSSKKYHLLKKKYYELFSNSIFTVFFVKYNHNVLLNVNNKILNID